MNHTLRLVIAAALLWLGAEPLAAEPMKCSGQNQACAASCRRLVDQSTPWRACMTACSQRLAACLRTGCWDNICGLMRR